MKMVGCDFIFSFLAIQAKHALSLKFEHSNSKPLYSMFTTFLPDRNRKIYFDTNLTIIAKVVYL